MHLDWEKPLALRKSRTTPYHLQSDGLVERCNRTLLSICWLLQSQNDHFKGKTTWEDCAWHITPASIPPPNTATELWQPENHQPSQSSMCTAQVGLKWLSCTPGSHSVCAVRTLLGVDQKILSPRREPILRALVAQARCPGFNSPFQFPLSSLLITSITLLYSNMRQEF